MSTARASRISPDGARTARRDARIRRLPPSPLFVSLAAIAMLVCLPRDAYALRVTYHLDFTAERNDNLLVVPEDPTGLTILRPAIAFDASHDSSVLQLDLTGRTEYRRYDDPSFDDTVDSNISGRLNWVVAPERLHFGIADSLTLQPVDTLEPDAPGNRQQVNVVSAGPTLFFELGPSWRGIAELHYVRSTAEITDQFNSRRSELALRTVKSLSPTNHVALNVQAQRVDFDDDLIARDYDRTDLFARWSRTLARFDLGLDLGYTRLDYRRPLEGFADTRSDPLLRADIAWRPNDSHRLSARLSSLFSDTATDALNAIDPDAGLPGQITPGETVVNASPFLERRLDTEYVHSATRWTFEVSPYITRLRYNETDEFDQNGYGTGFDFSWRARGDLQVGGAASLNHNSYVRLDREDETRRYSAYVRYDRSRHWSGTLTLARYERSSSAGTDASQNVITITISYSNR